MAKKSKNNEVYKIEIEIDNLTKEQYESIWAQLVDISGHSGKEITMKGGLEEPSDESSGLHKHIVNASTWKEKLEALIGGLEIENKEKLINDGDVETYKMLGEVMASRIKQLKYWR